MMSCRESLLLLIGRPEGASTAELFDHFKHLSRCTVQNVLSELRGEGRLFGLRWVDDRGSSRYFASREALNAWREANPKRVTQRDLKAAAKASPKPRPLTVADRLLAALIAAEWQGLTREAAAAAAGTKNHDTISRLTLDLFKAGRIAVERHKQRVLFFAVEFHNKARVTAWREEVDATLTQTAKRAAVARRDTLARRKKFSIVRTPAGQPAPVCGAQWPGPTGPVDYSRARTVYGKPVTFNRIQDMPDLPPDPRYPSFASQPLGSSLARTE